jgi:hypothetical protein
MALASGWHLIMAFSLVGTFQSRGNAGRHMERQKQACSPQVPSSSLYKATVATRGAPPL